MLKLRTTALASDLLRRFARDRRAVAATEFALVAPLLVTMLGGAVELSGAITAGNRATYVADAIGELVSQASKTLTKDDVEGFIRSAALMDPDIIRYASQSGKSLETAVDVTVSSVQFELDQPNCKSDCKYNAFVVFSRALAGAVRPCGKLTPSAASGAANLPPDVYSPGALVVVDVVVKYKPLMTIITGGSEFSFQRASYFRPRYVARVTSTTNCPAYVLG